MADNPDTVLCRFVTRLPPQYTVPESSYAIPTDSTRLELSQLINVLIGTEEQRPFDFLIDGVFLYASLADQIALQGLRLEDVIEVEYILAQPPPTENVTLKVTDWVSTIIPDVDQTFQLSGGPISIAGTYDGSLTLFSFKPTEAMDDIVGTRLSAYKLFATPAKAICVTQYQDRPLVAVGGYEGRVFCCSVSSDSNTLVGELEYKPLESPILSLASTKAGGLLAIGTADGHVYLHDTMKVSTIERHRPKREEAAQEPFAKRAYTSQRIETEPERLNCAFGSHQRGSDQLIHPFMPNHEVNGLTITKDDACLAAGCSDGFIRVFDLRTKKPLTHILHTSACQCVKYMTTDVLAAGFHDNTLRLFDTRLSSPCVRTFVGHRASVMCLDIKEDSFISGSLAGDLSMWDPRSPIALWTIDCFYRALDHKKDQSRLLACAFAKGPAILHGGSDRHVTMRLLVQ
ncbi:Transducin [Giardia muris]|uniref:Transducin n=1 Tax=Giardia muris TaxID=5742 RepID=A0A4Z1T936_GIAMU|nr:Transducin [Giardia muris]|eukprot:TNJ29021.1 Transducin [Giardia muris]